MQNLEDQFKDKFAEILFNKAPICTNVLENIVNYLPTKQKLPFLIAFENFMKAKDLTDLQLLYEQFLKKEIPYIQSLINKKDCFVTNNSNLGIYSLNCIIYFFL